MIKNRVMFLLALILLFIGCQEKTELVKEKSIEGNYCYLTDCVNEVCYNEVFIDSNKFYFYFEIMGYGINWSYKKVDSFLYIYNNYNELVYESVYYRYEKDTLNLKISDTICLKYCKINDSNSLGDFVKERIGLRQYKDAYYSRLKEWKVKR